MIPNPLVSPGSFSIKGNWIDNKPSDALRWGTPRKPLCPDLPTFTAPGQSAFTGTHRESSKAVHSFSPGGGRGGSERCSDTFFRPCCFSASAGGTTDCLRSPKFP
ncbi:hypothetical protein Q5P01_014230 [Channa striata]|uniref:Uncharacterized protein n=1 Tax=Channa striata TaxID=64152 RepID=A0AA88MNW2_CHASR|nr:hypothetical protein Q5P01_014230 [Channa striata]